MNKLPTFNSKTCVLQVQYKIFEQWFEKNLNEIEYSRLTKQNTHLTSSTFKKGIVIKLERDLLL